MITYIRGWVKLGGLKAAWALQRFTQGFARRYLMGAVCGGVEFTDSPWHLRGRDLWIRQEDGYWRFHPMGSVEVWADRMVLREWDPETVGALHVLRLDREVPETVFDRELKAQEEAQEKEMDEWERERNGG